MKQTDSEVADSDARGDAASILGDTQESSVIKRIDKEEPLFIVDRFVKVKCR